MLTYIVWDVRPEIFSSLEIPRWYGVFWAMGIFLSISVGEYIFRTDERPAGEIDKLTVFLIVGSILGARLGHILFYDPLHYWQHPIEILPVSLTPDFHFTGLAGLASHGGGIGLITAAFIFSRQNSLSFPWLLDRIAVLAPLCGVFIRLGNLLNSEIIGIPSNMPWAFVFTNVDSIPRHPAQLYEAIYCALLFLVMYYLWRRKRAKWPSGVLFGLTLTILFSLRFMDECLKVNQESFEDSMMLNMGQILSIPYIIIGIMTIITKIYIARKDGRITYS